MQVKENTNIVQANFLIENRPKLTKDETRLFLTILGAINKGDEDFKKLKIPVTDFADLWGIDTKNAYETIRKTTTGLQKKLFLLETTDPNTGERDFVSISCLYLSAYKEGEGHAIVKVPPEFKPYLLELKKNYTRYVLKNILNLSTVNAIRNYELLKQYESLGSRAFSVEEYKKMLSIEEKYSLNADLRRFVLDTAVEEINQKTDILVDYEFIGRGKKAKITFTICPNEKKKTLPSSVAKSEAPDLTSEDEFIEDYTINPLEKTFKDEAAKSEYIENYIATVFEHERNKELIEFIPEEVHGYKEHRIVAIRGIVVLYLPPHTISPIEKEMWIMKTLGRYAIRVWAEKKDNVKFKAYGYYLDDIERWLKNNYSDE